MSDTPPESPPLPVTDAPTLSYVRPGTVAIRRRPPLKFSVVGWVSIAASVLAVVGNVLSICLAWTWMPPRPRPVVAQVATTTTLPAPPALPPAPVVVPYNGDLFGPQGLSAPERKLVLEHAQKKSRITPRGRDALNAILAECGRDFLPSSGAALTQAEVGQMLRVVKDLPRVEPGWPQYEPWPLTLGGPGGRVEISRSESQFIPLKGPTVSINGPCYVDESRTEWWSYAAIKKAADSFLARSADQPTAVQLGAFVADRRSAPRSPGPNETVGTFGAIFVDKTLLVEPSWGNNILIDIDGRVTHTTGAVTDHALVTAPVFPPAQVAVVAVPPPSLPPQLGRGGAWVLLIESMISLFVAPLLYVAGRHLTRHETAAIGWSHAYAAAQMALNVIGGVISITLGAAIYVKLTLPEPDTSALIGTVVIGFLIGSIWPFLMVVVTTGEDAGEWLVNSPEKSK